MSTGRSPRKTKCWRLGSRAESKQIGKDLRNVMLALQDPEGPVGVSVSVGEVKASFGTTVPADRKLTTAKCG